MIRPTVAPDIIKGRVTTLIHAVISKGDSSIGIRKGMYGLYDLENTELFDLDMRRIPLSTIEFIPLSEPRTPPPFDSSPTLHVVTEDCHLLVERRDRILTLQESVKITTSKPAIKLDCLIHGLSDNVARSKHFMIKHTTLEVI